MSTNNFNWDNVLVAVEVDENFEMDWLIESLQEDLAKIKDSYYRDSYENERRGGKIIYSVDIARFYKDYGTAVYKTIDIVVRSGYYDGINIDYVIVDSNDYYDFKGTKGLDKEVAKVAAKVAAVIKKHGTELLQLGSFSNGEAIYQLKK